MPLQSVSRFRLRDLRLSGGGFEAPPGLAGGAQGRGGGALGVRVLGFRVLGF